MNLSNITIGECIKLGALQLNIEKK